MYGQNNSNNYRPAYTNKPTNYNNRQPLRPAGDRNNNNNNNNNYTSNYQNFPKKPHQYQQQPLLQSNRPNMVRSSSNPDGSNFLSDNWRTPVKENTSNGKSTGTFSLPEDMRNRLAANKSQQDKRDEPVKPQLDDLRNKLNAAKSNQEGNAARSNQEGDLRSRIISKMNNAMLSNSNVPKQQPVPKIIDLTTNPMKVQQTTQQQPQTEKLSIANRLNISNRSISNTTPVVSRSTSAGSLTPTPQNETKLTVIKDYTQYHVSFLCIFVLIFGFAVVYFVTTTAPMRAALKLGRGLESRDV